MSIESTREAMLRYLKAEHGDVSMMSEKPLMARVRNLPIVALTASSAPPMRAIRARHRYPVILPNGGD
jgi:hypothetical protein